MGHGGKAGPAGEVSPVTCFNCTKFHSNPSTPSRGFPGPISSPAVFPGLFRRGSRELGSARLGDFPAVFFQRTPRANGEREKAAIQYPDTSCHVLEPCQVSASFLYSFYRLPGPYLFLPGPPDLFHRGPRNSTASVASAFFPRSFSHGRYGQTKKERRRQFCTQTPYVMHNNPTEFHVNPRIPSIGSPGPNRFYRAFPVFFFRRGPRWFHSPRPPRPFFPPVFFKPTARANGVRENAEIWYTDPSGHVLDAHRVSSLSSDGNPFNRRTDRRTDKTACVYATEKR